MSSLNTKICLVIGAVLLGVGLWLADKKGPAKEPEKTAIGTKSTRGSKKMDWILFADSVIASSKTLSASPEFVRIYKQIKTGKASVENFDTVSSVLLRNKYPLAAAVIYRMKAELTKSAADWALAAEFFYKAAHFSNDSFSSSAMRECVYGFRKATELDNTNLKYKTQLGSSIVESTENPMEGITILREVVSVDSTFVDAHLQLALFAIQSGQFEKAISRLEKVLRIQPDYAVAYLYMGQAYQQSGKISQAIAALEKYQNEINDPALRDEVRKYIDQLKKTSNS